MTDAVEIKVETSRPYSIWVGAELLERVADLLPLPEPVEVGVLIADARPFAAHGARAETGLAPACGRIERCVLPGGEQLKSMRQAEDLLRRLAASGAHRTDLVAALGGGAVGDLAGFVAAVYHRGMPFVQLPTTLLAQVDAAIGGKTAVNLPEGKNLVGAFHQPVAVVCDVTTLTTLPPGEFASGAAEVVKHGLIGDAAILGLVTENRAAIEARRPDALAELVAKAAAVKAGVVSRDETEQGSRAFLNYGHTLGHALETIGGYTRWRHGEAVAIGMMFAAHVARGLGYTDLVDAHRAAIEAVGLPAGGADAPFDLVHEAMSRDKKYLRGIRFVVLEDLARPRLVRDVPEAILRAAYAEVSA